MVVDGNCHWHHARISTWNSTFKKVPVRVRFWIISIIPVLQNAVSKCVSVRLKQEMDTLPCSIWPSQSFPFQIPNAFLHSKCFQVDPNVDGEKGAHFIMEILFWPHWVCGMVLETSFLVSLVRNALNFVITYLGPWHDQFLISRTFSGRLQKDLKWTRHWTKVSEKHQGDLGPGPLRLTSRRKIHVNFSTQFAKTPNVECTSRKRSRPPVMRQKDTQVSERKRRKLQCLCWFHEGCCRACYLWVGSVSFHGDRIMLCEEGTKWKNGLNSTAFRNYERKETERRSEEPPNHIFRLPSKLRCVLVGCKRNKSTWGAVSVGSLLSFGDCVVRMQIFGTTAFWQLRTCNTSRVRPGAPFLGRQVNRHHSKRTLWWLDGNLPILKRPFCEILVMTD